MGKKLSRLAHCDNPLKRAIFGIDFDYVGHTALL